MTRLGQMGKIEIESTDRAKDPPTHPPTVKNIMRQRATIIASGEIEKEARRWVPACADLCDDCISLIVLRCAPVFRRRNIDSTGGRYWGCVRILDAGPILAKKSATERPPRALSRGSAMGASGISLWRNEAASSADPEYHSGKITRAIGPSPVVESRATYRNFDKSRNPGGDAVTDRNPPSESVAKPAGERASNATRLLPGGSQFGKPMASLTRGRAGGRLRSSQANGIAADSPAHAILMWGTM